MKISEFLHLALPEEQWLPTISGVLRQFAEEECYVYERQPCYFFISSNSSHELENARGLNPSSFLSRKQLQLSIKNALAFCILNSNKDSL